MPVPLMIAGGAQAAGGIISGITGLSQKRKAKKLLNSLGDQPLYNIPNEVLQNQKMAQLSASEGLPSQQYNNAMKNIQESQRNALSSSLDRRSALMALPKIQREANNAYGRLDAADATARMNNQKTLYGINSQVAGYRDKEFQVNKMQPWERKYQYAQGLLGAGNQNLSNGIEKVVGGIGTAFGGGSGGLLGGMSGMFSGSGRKMKAGAINDPTYYGGYNSGSDYGGFETGFPE